MRSAQPIELLVLLVWTSDNLGQNKMRNKTTNPPPSPKKKKINNELALNAKRAYLFHQMNEMGRGVALIFI